MTKNQILQYIRKHRNVIGELDLFKTEGFWYFSGDSIDQSKETLTCATTLSQYSLTLWLSTYDEMAIKEGI